MAVRHWEPTSAENHDGLAWWVPKDWMMAGTAVLSFLETAAAISIFGTPGQGDRIPGPSAADLSARNYLSRGIGWWVKSRPAVTALGVPTIMEDATARP